MRLFLGHIANMLFCQFTYLACVSLLSSCNLQLGGGVTLPILENNIVLANKMALAIFGH
jgi:hypothetical protein